MLKLKLLYFTTLFIYSLYAMIAILENKITISLTILFVITYIWQLWLYNKLYESNNKEKISTRHIIFVSLIVFITAPALIIFLAYHSYYIFFGTLFFLSIVFSNPVIIRLWK